MRPDSSQRPVGSVDPSTSERERAVRTLETRRKFRGDAVAYVAVNVFLIIVWLLTGRGYFWPGWVLSAWGVLLALDGWNAYLRKPISDQDIELEMRRMRG